MSALEPSEILAFAKSNPELIRCNHESVDGIPGSFYTLNYTDEANELPPEQWHAVTLICRGLVLHDLDGELSVAISCCPKFFSWPRAAELPDPVRFRRKVDGSCVHATALRLHGSEELTWLVGTR